jgi:hypothetical protein
MPLLPVGHARPVPPCRSAIPVEPWSTARPSTSAASTGCAKAGPSAVWVSVLIVVIRKVLGDQNGQGTYSVRRRLCRRPSFPILRGIFVVGCPSAHAHNHSRMVAREWAHKNRRRGAPAQAQGAQDDILGDRARAGGHGQLPVGQSMAPAMGQRRPGAGRPAPGTAPGTAAGGVARPPARQRSRPQSRRCLPPASTTLAQPWSVPDRTRMRTSAGVR